MNIGTKIQRERKRLNITQDKLSEHLSISRQAIAKWENGDAYPELEKIVLLSDFFNVSTDYLLRDDIEEPFSYNRVVKKENKYFFFFITGIIFFILGIIDVLFFYIMSKVKPVTFYDLETGSTTTYGLFRYMNESGLKNLFYFFMILGAIGIIFLAIYFMLKNYKQIKISIIKNSVKKNKNTDSKK